MEKNNNLMIISIVAIVAIVGLIFSMGNFGGRTYVASEGSYLDADLAGQASRFSALQQSHATCDCPTKTKLVYGPYCSATISCNGRSVTTADGKTTCSYSCFGDCYSKDPQGTYVLSSGFRSSCSAVSLE